MAFEALLHAADHSAVVEIRFLASEMPKEISVSPRWPVLSSSGIVWWSDTKIWLSSTESPLRIHSHCEEGIPEGEFGAILM